MKIRFATHSTAVFRAARILALALMAVGAAAKGAAPTEGEIPPGWRQKTVHLEMAEGEHANVLRTGWMSLKDFGEGDPPRDVPVLRFLGPDADGMVRERGPTLCEYAVRRVEVVGCGSGQIWVSPTQTQRTPDCQWVRFGWTLTPWGPGERSGDVLPAVVFCENDSTHWSTKPFALRCGGKGRHAGCNQCFSLVTVSGAGARTPAAVRTAPAASAPQSPAAPPPPGQAEMFPSTLILWRLSNDTPVYSLDAPPYANGIASAPVDALPAGTPVRVLGRIPPFCLLIRYTTPEGEPRDVAAFASDFPDNILPETE